MISPGVRQVVWASLGVMTQGVGRLVANVLVGRAAGPAVLGSMATVLAVSQILVTLWPGSLGSAGVKFIAQARGRDDQAAVVEIRSHLVLRSLQGCLLLGAVGAAGWALTGGTLLESAVVVVVVVALGTYGLAQGLLYAERRTRTSSIRETCAAVFSLVAVAAILLVHPDVPGAVLALPLAIGLLGYAAAGWPRGRPRSLRSRGRELDLFTLTSALGSVSSQGFIQLSVVVAAWSGRTSAGEFAVALALCTPLTLVVTPLGLALFPAVNEALGRGNSDAVRRQLTVATHFLTYALLLGGGLMVLLREPVIGTVWGTEFARSGDIFVPLVLASALAAIALPATNGLTAASQRYATRATTWSIGSAVVGVASWLVLVPRYEAVGVAVGLMIGRAVFAVAVLESARRLHEMVSWAGLALRALAVVAAMAVIETTLAPIVVKVAAFAVVGLVAVAGDRPMRSFIQEQGLWLTRR
jgi:putative peptidoglycan lipid II flippase